MREQLVRTQQLRCNLRGVRLNALAERFGTYPAVFDLRESRFPFARHGYIGNAHRLDH